MTQAQRQRLADKLPGHGIVRRTHGTGPSEDDAARTLMASKILWLGNHVHHSALCWSSLPFTPAQPPNTTPTLGEQGRARGTGPCSGNEINHNSTLCGALKRKRKLVWGMRWCEAGASVKNRRKIIRTCYKTCLFWSDGKTTLWGLKSRNIVWNTI